MKPAFLTAEAVRQHLDAGLFDARLRGFYGVSGDALVPYRSRIAAALDRFSAIYGDRPVRIFSVSGRTELGGNHTDHQHGNVLAGGITQDILAVAALHDCDEIRVQSEGYPEDVVSLSDLDIHADETGTSAALLRGTAARFQALGRPAGGFVAYTVSDVMKGSGLSSSAAFEVLLGTICNDFFADSAFSGAELAQIAQFAENQYFGKPCGLMDQMACALGGITAIDFADPAQPVWEQVQFDLKAAGYALCIIDSGADHAGLTDEYAAVPAEMQAVAAVLGKTVLYDTEEAVFWDRLPEIRKACGDRAVLRTMHFYRENRRVLKMEKALRDGRTDDYLALVRESGRSSLALLQNISPAGRPREQAVAVAIAVCEEFLEGKGAVRVHGGGFAGTVQAYVPLDRAQGFRRAVNRMLGENACQVLQIRSCGASALWENEEEHVIC